MGDTNDKKRSRFPFGRHVSRARADREGSGHAIVQHTDPASSSLRRLLHSLNPWNWRHASGSAEEWSGRSQSQVSNAAPEVKPETAQAALASVHDSTERTLNDVKLSSVELDISREIWNNAYAQLKQNQPLMVEIYEKVLSSQLTETAIAQVLTIDAVNCFAGCTADDRMEMMENLAKKSKQKAENRSAIEGEIAAAAEILKGVAGFITSFVAAYPPAAMALSGFSTVLTLLVKPLQENQDMVAGLEYVMEVSERYMAFCRLLLRETWPIDSDFQEARGMVRARVTSLYVAVLTYQMKCVCRCYHDHPIMTSIKAVLGRINWKSETELIKVREEGVQSDARLYNSQAMVEMLRSIESDAHELTQIRHLLDRINRGKQDEKLVRILKEKEENKRYQSELTGRFNVTSYETQMKVNSLHVKGTCKWFCAHNDFRRWLGPDSSRILLVSANPGCGKSVLANYLVNEVIPRKKPEATICYYFFKDNAEQKEVSNAYSAILHALFLGNGLLADNCKFDIEQAGPNLTKWPASLWKIFEKAVKLSHAGPIICILDALDECSAEGLRIMVENLTSLYTRSSELADTSDVRFLLTTRGYPAIIERFDRLNPLCVRLAGENTNEAKSIQKEIDEVVKHRLYNFKGRRGFGETQREKLWECIKRRGGEQRTYIWVSLVFEVLEGAYPDNNDRWEELVNNLPQTAYAAYEKLLERVQPEEKKRVTRLLHLILVAFRPLSLQEMNIALNLHERPGSDSIDDLNMVSDEAFRDWIVNTCGFFVTEYGGNLYFIHQTAKEFLLWIGDGSGEKRVSQGTTFSSLLGNMDLKSAHASMAESCISYLSLQSCRTGPVRDSISKFVLEMRRDPEDWGSAGWNSVVSHPFAAYVIRFWPTHFRHAQRSKSESICTDVGDEYFEHYVTIFEDFELQHPAMLATLRAQSTATLWTDPDIDPGRITISTLNAEYDSCLLYFTDKLRITGLATGTAKVLDSHRVKDLAALFGHHRVLRARISQSSASSHFSFRGALAFVYTLGQGTNPDPLPVISAVIGRSVPCLTYIISCGSRLDLQGPEGWTPMHWAAYMGYADVVDSLLKHLFPIDVCNHDGQTPLLLTLASSNVQIPEAVVRLLVLGSCGRKASVTATTSSGHTPLHLAAGLDWSMADERLKGVERQGHMSPYIPTDALQSSVIKLLVDNGANLNAVDHQGQTPLMLACSKGRWESVACLLYSGADPNKLDSDGCSLLATFVRSHFNSISRSFSIDLAIVKLLLEHGADPNAAIDDAGDKLLHFVCASFDTDLVPVLLFYNADVSARDRNGRTPIQIAAQERRDMLVPCEKCVVQLLKKDADPIKPDENTYLGVPLYLDSAEFTVNTQTGNSGTRLMTPLHWACQSANSYLIRQLLDYGADPKAVDSNGRTPMHLLFDAEKVEWKDRPWIEKSVRLLLGKGASLRTPQDRNGDTPAALARHSKWEWLRNAIPEFD